MDRLDLTDKERLAMLYVLVKQVSQEDFSNLFPKFGRSPPSFAAFAGLVSIGMLPCRLYHIMQSTFTTFTSARHHFGDLASLGALPWHGTASAHHAVDITCIHISPTTLCRSGEPRNAALALDTAAAHHAVTMVCIHISPTLADLLSTSMLHRLLK